MPLHNVEVEARLLVKAYDLGHSIAKKLVPGDVFLGALPEGRKHYETGSSYLSMFVNGYLDGLPGHPVVTSQGNVIIEFQRDIHRARADVNPF